MTLSRKNLLCQSMAAAVAFIGCSGRWALAQEPQRRREIVVNGKRVRTVDMHTRTAISRRRRRLPATKRIFRARHRPRADEGDGRARDRRRGVKHQLQFLG